MYVTALVNPYTHDIEAGSGAGPAPGRPATVLVVWTDDAGKVW